MKTTQDSVLPHGVERDRMSEFVYFLRVARASCGEVRSQLYAAFDEGYLADSACTLYSRRSGRGFGKSSGWKSSHSCEVPSNSRIAAGPAMGRPHSMHDFPSYHVVT